MPCGVFVHASREIGVVFGVLNGVIANADTCSVLARGNHGAVWFVCSNENARCVYSIGRVRHAWHGMQRGLTHNATQHVQRCVR